MARKAKSVSAAESARTNLSDRLMVDGELHKALTELGGLVVRRLNLESYSEALSAINQASRVMTLEAFEEEMKEYRETLRKRLIAEIAAGDGNDN